MSSLIYNNALWELVKGNVDFDTDTFKCLLVTNSYTPDKDADNRRDDVTNEVASGGGYTTGGASVSVSVSAIDTANDRIEVVLGAASWPTSTITARGAVYYKSRGGASSADEIIAYIDFGSDISSAGGTFSLSASTLRFQN